MAELIANNIYQEFTFEMLKTPIGMAKFNAILSRIAQSLPGDSETVGILFGIGDPESSITANVGSLYLRFDGSAGTTLYIKESGTGNTGWTAVTAGGSSSNPIYFGNSTTNGSWRIGTSGNNLVQERREGGVWVEKVAATP